MGNGKQTPHIIWQTWKSKDPKNIPIKVYPFTLKWRSLHPSCRYFLLDDTDLRQIVKRVNPEYINKYDSFTHNIERVDFARYALLYLYGGVYADLDTEPLKNIKVFIKQNKIVLGCEPEEHAQKIYKRDRVVCNALMISPPGERFWIDFMKYIIKNYQYKYKPVENTGPMALTKFLETHIGEKYEKNILITNPCIFFPLTGTGQVSSKCDIRKSYVKHVWQNSWVRVWYKDPMWFNLRYWTVGLFLLFFVLFIILINNQNKK